MTRKLLRLWAGLLVLMALVGVGRLSAGEPAESAPEAAPAQASARVFHLVLRGLYVEHKSPQGVNPLAILTGGSVKQKSFMDLIGFLDRAAKDETLKGLFIDLQDAEIGLTPSQVSVLLARLDALHAAGKTLFTYIQGGTKLQFLIACHCDVVVMPELSTLEIAAPAMQVMFFKDTLDAIGVNLQAIRAGAYKSAVEPMTRTSMSPEMKENYTALLTDLDAQITQLVLNGRRKITPEAYRELRKDQIITSKQAQTAGLVDRLAGLEEMTAIMEKQLGGPIKLEEKKKAPPPQLNIMSLFAMERTEPVTRWKSDGVGVLFLRGDIVDGRGDPRVGEEIAEVEAINAIRGLIDDERCKAVVLRIDSPGGSASASERINRVLKELAGKKTLVVSMGDYAASGGYYIAAPAQEIFAQPTTVTGSIGVFGVVPDVGGLLKKIGVNTETLSVDGSVPLSGMQALTERQRTMYERDIDEAYQTFLSRVSEGRGKTTEEIHKIAQGRVYTGSQALAVGLVDKIGTLEDAIAAAAARAKLPADCDRQYFPKYPEMRGLMEFIEALNPEAQTLPLEQLALHNQFPLLAELQATPAVRQLTGVLRQIRLQTDDGRRLGIYAWLPFAPKFQ